MTGEKYATAHNMPMRTSSSQTNFSMLLLFSSALIWLRGSDLVLRQTSYCGQLERVDAQSNEPMIGWSLSSHVTQTSLIGCNRAPPVFCYSVLTMPRCRQETRIVNCLTSLARFCPMWANASQESLASTMHCLQWSFSCKTLQMKTMIAGGVQGRSYKKL